MLPWIMDTKQLLYVAAECIIIAVHSRWTVSAASRFSHLRDRQQPTYHVGRKLVISVADRGVPDQLHRCREKVAVTDMK